MAGMWRRRKMEQLQIVNGTSSWCCLDWKEPLCSPGPTSLGMKHEALGKTDCVSAQEVAFYWISPLVHLGLHILKFNISHKSKVPTQKRLPSAFLRNTLLWTSFLPISHSWRWISPKHHCTECQSLHSVDTQLNYQNSDSQKVSMA